jgi:hypothetical protein
MEQERGDYDDAPGRTLHWPPPLWALGFMVPWALIVAGTLFYVLRELVAGFGP